MLNRILFVFFLVAGCAAIGELPAPCDSLTLAQLSKSCRDRVRRDCARDQAGVVDEKCPTLVECSRRIKNWHECRDGGADVVADGGAK